MGRTENLKYSIVLYNIKYITLYQITLLASPVYMYSVSWRKISSNPGQIQGRLVLIHAQNTAPQMSTSTRLSRV